MRRLNVLLVLGCHLLVGRGSWFLFVLEFLAILLKSFRFVCALLAVLDLLCFHLGRVLGLVWALRGTVGGWVLLSGFVPRVGCVLVLQVRVLAQVLMTVQEDGRR